ncbi:LysR family transcriptional regulator [Nodosilinea nodulosa]|uniref:LysR family transcriptional regulator n=1 Tax=Nodosilinea nodulosa TaxID=416001 RepID=UPI00031CF39C|nr:LysR family transcriptional regulator [Nodosilinea nodulosa]
MTNIHHINLAGLDLNLLVVFDALIAAGSVTRAGERLGLSQPATSNALARLRRLTGDDLFVRTAAGLRPTPRALALAQQLSPVLRQIQGALLEDVTFDPATSDRVFAIGMSDYVEFTLLPRLMQRLQSVAPGVSLQIRSGDRQALFALLDEGAIDIACGLFPEAVPWHQEQPLFQETYLCAARPGHPSLGDALSLDNYLALPHLLVSVKEDRVGRVDNLLAKQGLKRQVALSVPHFLAAPFVLAQTDLIATLARRVALGFAQTQPLKLLPLPFELEGFSIAMRWHRSSQSSPPAQWLRSLIGEVAQTL